MQFRRLLLFFALVLFVRKANAGTVLILQFHNDSLYTDLNWVGESIAETLRTEFSAQNEIVLDRDSRAEGMRRLTLRSDAGFTKATIIRLGQTLDADFVLYGNYDIRLPGDNSQLKDSSLQVTSHILDLRRLRDGPVTTESGKLLDLSQLEENLAWQSLKFLEPKANLPIDQFISPQKLVRLDVKESYIRGLLSPNKEQQEKWFAQALALDPKFSNAAFEMGKLALGRGDYKQAISFFQRIPATDLRYNEARFKMGLSAYGAGDYTEATNYFREVLKQFPLNEVYNNLAAAEDRLNLPVAMDDFRKALNGDPSDPVYLFNMGAVLLRYNYFDEAKKNLQTALDHNPEDAEARTLADRARLRESTPAGSKPIAVERLKLSFDETAFLQLKAMLQPKAAE